MARAILEKDWKYLRTLIDVMIDRFCLEILNEAETIIRKKRKGKSLKVYQNLYRMIHEREKQLVEDLNDFRRSNAINKTIVLYSNGLMTDEELKGFSMELQNLIRAWVSDQI